MTPPGDGGRAAGGWKVGHAVAAFSAGVLASLPAYLAVRSGGLSVFEAFAVVGGAQTLVTIGVVAWLARAPGRLPLQPAPRWRDAGYPFLGAGLAVAVSWATYLVVRLLSGGEVPAQSVVQVADEAEGWRAWTAVVVVSVLLAPLAEELVFRGVLLAALQRRLTARAAVVSSAGVFALAHLALDFDAAAAVPALFVAGLVLAEVTRRRNRLGPAVLTHVGFNLVGVLALLVA